MVAPMTLVSAISRPGGFAGDHGLVDRAAPSSRMPSTGIFSPGLTRSRSPGFTCSSGISSSLPSGRADARLGLRSSSARMAALVRLRARNSMTWPSKTRVVIAAADSKRHRDSRPCRASTRKNLRRDRGDDAVYVGDAGAHADQREHVRTAIDERSPETLEEGSATPEHDGRGQGELEPGEDRAPRRAMKACGHAMLPMAIASRGAVRARLIQKRRVMSRSSGFSSSRR